MNQLKSRTLAALFMGAAFAPLSPFPVGGQQLPLTWQEENDYRAGPTPFEPLMEFWYELASMHPTVSVRPLTQTLLDREFTLVSVSSTPITSPQDAIRSGRTIVLIANAVHGAETAGKEASQLIARDLVSGELRSLLDDVIVLFVPLVNPDGGEVRRRTNEEGFDMNRDYLKLESQEIHALVTRVMNEWTPDIHVDTHHGGAAPYTLTWQGTLNPAADQELRAYPYDVIFPRLRAALRAEDYDGFDYSGPQTRGEAVVWASTSVEPRKHHVYTGLTNSIGILLETPSNSRRLRENGTIIEEVPASDRYYHQVRGQYIALREILTVAAQSRLEIRALTSGARDRAIRSGMTFDEADQIVLDYALQSRGSEEVWVPEPSAPLGYERRTVEILLEWSPTRTAARPLGYLLPVSMARAVPLLLSHGIVVHRLTAPATLELEVYDATEVLLDSYFQGHYLKEVIADRSIETVEMPAGAFYISTAQSRANLISYLLEPETDDNLITWGYADHLLQMSETRAREDPQRVPMMRLIREQPMSLLEVVPFNDFDPNRYFQTW